MAVAALLWGVVPGAGQTRELPATLELTTPGAPPLLRVGDILLQERFLEALHEGLPIRIRVVTELWRDRLLDSQEGRVEWRATMVTDPLPGNYRLSTSDTRGELVVATLEELRVALQRGFPVPLRPTRPGVHYYLATMEVQTLSLTDLEELQRWLRGELTPALTGEGGRVDGAVTRGLARALQRALRLPALRVRLETPRFRYDPA